MLALARVSFCVAKPERFASDRNDDGKTDRLKEKRYG